MRSLLTLVLTLLAIPAVAADRSPADDIVGQWRGTSKCVDLTNYPNCKDELVVYDVARTSSPSQVTMKADKVVDEKRLFMGEFTFTFEAGTGTWASDLQNERVHMRWRFKVSGDEMSGTLTDLRAADRLVRRVSVRRTRGYPSTSAKLTLTRREHPASSIVTP